MYIVFITFLLYTVYRRFSTAHRWRLGICAIFLRFFIYLYTTSGGKEKPPQDEREKIMTRTQTNYYDTVKQIATMMMEEGWTAAEVIAVSQALQHVKASIWDQEKLAGRDLGSKTIGNNSWTLEKVAMYMEEMGDTSRDFWTEDYRADAAADTRFEVMELLWGNAGIEWLDEDIAEGHKYDKLDARGGVILTDDDTDNNDNDDDNDDDYTPYYNDDELLAFLGDFADEYDIEAIRSDVTFYDYQDGQRYWEPAYTDDADALMRVCDLHHMEEFEECPYPALQAEIDAAKREDECKDDDDEYEAWQRLKAKADLIPDEAYTELDNALTDEAYMIYSGKRLELADGTPTSWTWLDPATFLVSELHEFTAIIDDEGHQGYYAYKAPAADPDLDAIRNALPDFAYCGTDAPEVIEIQKKLRAADAHASVDDSWMDRRCYATIRAKDASSGQRIDVDPPTWRDKLEMEHKLREDGYEFVDVTTDGPNLVLLWYRPMMPRPMVDELIDTIKGC